MSFKLKLVAYFLLVSLLPLGAAAWGLHAVARRSETRGVDVRLEAGLRAVLASYKDELRAAGDKAAALASNRRFQRALLTGDRRTLRRVLADSPGVRLESRVLTFGPQNTIGPASEVSVTSDHRVLGTLVAGVPLRGSSVTSLSDRVGLSSDDTLVVVEGQTVAAGPARLHGARFVPPLRAHTLEVAGDRYRVLATQPQRGRTVGDALGPRRALRAAAHGRPSELRHPHACRPGVLGRPAADGRHARRSLRDRARERAPAPDRDPPGARRHAHRACEPAPLRGIAGERADARRAVRRLGGLRAGRPRRLQVGQ